MEKQAPRISLTPDMLKSFKSITCSCGGMLFQQGVVFKKISAFISPSGKEEIYPLEVVICQKCGKVPREFNNPDILPDEVLSANGTLKENPKPVMGGMKVVKDEDYKDQPTKDELS